MLNSSAMDIMYYTSPLYRDEVNVLASPPCCWAIQGQQIQAGFI
jgi:hypothetical protein